MMQRKKGGKEERQDENENEGGVMQDYANMVVSEIVDVGLLGEGVLASLMDAAKRLAAKHAICIPSSARVYAQLMEVPIQAAPLCFPLARVPIQVDSESKAKWEVDFSEFHVFRGEVTSYEQMRTSELTHRPLSSPFEVFNYDFQSLFDGDTNKCKPSGTRLAEVKVTQNGTFNAVMFWFDLNVFDGCTFSTSPYSASSPSISSHLSGSASALCQFWLHPPSHVREWQVEDGTMEGTPQRNCWKQAFTFMPSPLSVEEGQSVKMMAKYSDTRISFKPLSVTSTRGGSSDTDSDSDE